MPWIGNGLSISGQRRGLMASTAINSLGLFGDSIFYGGGSGNNGGAWQVAAAPPSGKTITVNAENSRTVGGGAVGGDLADTGTPTGNTLLSHSSEYALFNAALGMIGTNDLAAFTIATYEAHLISWYAGLTPGTKVYWSPPIPLRTDAAYDVSSGIPGAYAAWTAKRTSRWLAWRNPAVWGQWCDGLWPFGFQPDFNAADNTSLIGTDGVHPSQPGQDLMGLSIKATTDTLLDASRVNSTQMYDAAWPVSETNLTAGTTIKRRIRVSGIAHAGLSSGASVSGLTGATLSIPNVIAAGASIGTSSSNGYRLYNSDELELSVPLSVADNDPVSLDLTIGSETRTLTFRTVAAVTPATYAHQDVVSIQPADTVHTYSGLAFDNTGIGLLSVMAGATPTGITAGGVAATLVRKQTTTYNGELSVWTVPISATGARNVVVTFGSSKGQSTLSWGVVKDADATVQQTSPASNGASPGSESDPHQTVSLTVPASGIAIGFLGEYAGGSSVTPATANTGTTLVDEGQGSYLGEVIGIAVGKRTATGTCSFNFGFQDVPRLAAVFKAAGT